MTVNTPIVGSISTWSNEIVNIFIFPPSGNEAKAALKRGFDFRHSTRKAFRIRRKVVNGSFLTECLNTQCPSCLCLLCYERDTT